MDIALIMSMKFLLLLVHKAAVFHSAGVCLDGLHFEPGSSHYIFVLVAIMCEDHFPNLFVARIGNKLLFSHA